MDVTRESPDTGAASPGGGRSAASVLPQRALAARLYEALDRDLVYRFRLGGDPGFDYVSPSCLAMTGYAPDDFYADPDLVARLLHPQDRPLVDLEAPVSVPDGQVLRWIRRDGTTLWTEHRSVVLEGPSGPVAVEGVVTDVSDAATARQLLRVIDRSALRFAARAPGLAVLLDPIGRVVYANAALLELTGWTAAEVTGRRWSAVFLHPDDLRAGLGLLNAVEDGEGQARAPLLLRDGRRRDVAWATMAIPGSVRRPSVLAIGRDLTADAERDSELAQLRAAVAETADSVVVTDLSASIVSVNPAFERATGYTRDEAVGQNPRLLQSGHQGPAFYRSMWWLLSRGHPWRGELINRRADGGLLVEEASITPVRDAEGRVGSYVAVKRDVTSLRQLRGSLDDEQHHRERLAEAIERLSGQAGPEATAEGIVSLLGELPGVVAAAVGVLDGDRSGRYLAGSGMGQLGYSRDDPLDAVAVGRLSRLHGEPWVVSSAEGDRARRAALRRAGVGAIVHVPVLKDQVPIGLLVACGSEADGGDVLGQMAAIGEVAVVMRALLGPGASTRHARQVERARLAAVIAEHRYEIVFQPIVDLLSGRRAGYEALTRFTDGRSPGAIFAAARDCGMGADLEIATLRSAIAAARGLPPDAWLSVNASASVVAADEDFVGLLSSVPRDIVVEVTDDGSVEDLAAVRDALRHLGVTARLAVDEDGAGAMTPRRLMEVRPDYVKLDASLFRGVEGDDRRRHLVRALAAFAAASGGVLIAEGVELASEHEELARLGVPFGQGFLFGPPAPAADWSRRG